MNFSTPESIKQELHKSLGQLEKFEECALVNYPDHPNIGDGVYQFKQHGLVISNRLHAHILCLLLEIPHVFLANSYYKNQSFYETWSHQIPFCKFVKDASDVEDAAREILKKYPI